MWSGRVTICAFPLLLVPFDDAHSLPMNVIGKGMCVIVSGFLRWLGIMPSKPREISWGEDAPQNRLRKGWAVVKVSEFVFRVFCLILTICPVTHYGPFSMILDSFGYLHTPRSWSTRPFTKRLSRCGGKVICVSCFLPYTHHLPSHSLWSVFHGLRLVRIPLLLWR